MKKLMLIAILVLVLNVISCGPGETQSKPVIPVNPDSPYLTSQESIGIAKSEASTNYAWAYTAQIANLYVSSSKGWNANYTGNGKWMVELRISNADGSLTMYRWTVFETNLAATYTGAFRQPSPIEKLSSQQTASQVISIVVEHAVRNLSSYEGLLPSGHWISVHEVGQWTAVYENRGRWLVQGIVVFDSGQGTAYYESVWKYDYEKVQLDSLVRSRSPANS